MRLKRLPQAALLLAICSIFAGCKSHEAASTNGLTPLLLQLDWYPQPEHGGFYTAQLLGYYKAEGLNVTFLPLTQYGSAATMVTSGKADFGLASSDQILEWNANGLPVMAICATMQHDPQAIMVHKDSPIHEFKDLDGHAIAAQTGAVWLKFVTARYNLHNVRQIPSTMSIASFLSDPGYVQQIFVTNEPFFAKQAGAEVRTLMISDSGYDPYRVSFTTKEFAAAHPDVVAKFARASIRGWLAYLRDPSATNEYLLKLNPALNAQQEVFTAQALRDGEFVTGGDASGAQTGHMTAERWQATFEQLKSLGLLSGPIDPASAYSLKFVQ